MLTHMHVQSRLRVGMLVFRQLTHIHLQSVCLREAMLVFRQSGSQSCDSMVLTVLTTTTAFVVYTAHVAAGRIANVPILSTSVAA